MKILLSKQASKYLQSVDAATQHKLEKGIDDIRNARGDITKLKGTKSTYRFKIKHYRIIYEWQNDDTIIITRINTRTNIKY